MRTDVSIVLRSTRTLKSLNGVIETLDGVGIDCGHSQPHSECFDQRTVLQAVILHYGVQKSRTSQWPTSVHNNITTVAISATHHGYYDGSSEPPARHSRVANIPVDETGHRQVPPFGEFRHGITRPLRLTIPTQKITNMEPRATTKPAHAQATTTKGKGKINTIALVPTKIATHSI